MEIINFSHVTGFEWDEGNVEKNRKKHAVFPYEAEEVFFNEPFFVYYDEKHSGYESRFYLLGETNEKRHLFVVFTLRRDKIRIISARDMNKKEKKIYEELKKNSQV